VGLPTGFVDTNHDGHVTPIDALTIINHLNGQSQLHGEGEGSSVLATNAVTGAAPQAPLTLLPRASSSNQIERT